MIENKNHPKKPLGWIAGAFFTALILITLVALASDVAISRTSIAFNVINIADSEIGFGDMPELARHVDGRWEPVPYDFTGHYVMQTLLAYIMPVGEATRSVYGFELLFGELPPGRYMFIRSHWHSGSAEYLLIDFLIDESTPLRLSDAIVGRHIGQNWGWGQAFLSPPRHAVDVPTAPNIPVTPEPSDTSTPPQRSEALSIPQHINLVSQHSITPIGMSLELENTSQYSFALLLAAFYITQFWKVVSTISDNMQKEQQ